MAKKDKKRQKGSLDEPFLLSPQFDMQQAGWGKKISDWWQKYFKSIILPAIIVILIAGGIYAYTSRQGQIPEMEKLTASEQNQLQIQEEPIQNPQEQTEPTNEILSLGENEEAELVISSQDTGVFKQTAQAGEGITHLARKALKDYLETKRPELNLSAEQKIYCEDYLQNKTANRPLEIGEELSFSTTLIEEAIASSQGLTESQLQNLSQYVPLVPSLSA